MNRISGFLLFLLLAILGAQCAHIGSVETLSSLQQASASGVHSNVDTLDSDLAVSSHHKQLLGVPPKSAPAPKRKAPPTSISMASSSLTVKPNCCYFCYTNDTYGCYDVDNHQQRHNMAYVVAREVYQRPPTYCIPKKCLLKGSPFTGKPFQKTATRSGNSYTMSGPAAQPKKGPSKQVVVGAVVDFVKDTQFILKDSARVIVAASKLNFMFTWLDILASTFVAVRTQISGVFNLLQVFDGKLQILSSSLTALNTQVWIYGTSTMLVANSSVTFVLKGRGDPSDPVAWLLTTSKLDVRNSTLTFTNHTNVYFTDARVKLYKSKLLIKNSNVRFFDSILDLTGSKLEVVNSQVWFFNTTLIRDKKVVKVGGKAPVKLGDILGTKYIKGTKLSASFQVQ